MLYDAHDDVVRVPTPDDDEPPPVESNVGRPISEFRTPPEWREDATLISIYLYIRHHIPTASLRPGLNTRDNIARQKFPVCQRQTSS